MKRSVFLETYPGGPRKCETQRFFSRPTQGARGNVKRSVFLETYPGGPRKCETSAFFSRPTQGARGNVKRSVFLETSTPNVGFCMFCLIFACFFAEFLVIFVRPALNFLEA